MKWTLDKPNLVIVGGWNLNIFQPNWIKSYVFPEGEIKVEFPINAPFASPRYINSGIRLSIEGQRFILSIVEESESCFERIEELAYQMVDYLPHTPVSAFGINFSFIEENPSELDKLFSFSDEQELGDLGYNKSRSQIKRVFELSQQKELYLELSTDFKVLSLDFNYHVSIKDLVDLKEMLNVGDVRQEFEQSVNLIKSLHGYELQ